MLEILAIIFPIYLVAATGFGAVRAGLFRIDDLNVLSKFVLTFALPSLVFKTLAEGELAQVIDPAYLAAFIAASLAVLGAGIFYMRLRGNGMTKAIAAAMGMVTPNSGYIGYPTVLLVFGDIAGQVLTLNFIAENLVVIPLCLVLLEFSRREEGSHWTVLRGVLFRIVTHPIFIGLVSGVLVAAGGLTMPAPLMQGIGILAMASGALSLFVIGGLLAGLPIRGAGEEAAAISIGKLVMHPLLALGFALMLGTAGAGISDPVLFACLVLSTAMPIMSAYPVFVQRYVSGNYPAVAVVVTTILGFVTITAVLWALA